MSDFIPLNGDKSGKKRKHHHKDKSGEHRSSSGSSRSRDKSSERDRGRPHSNPSVKQEARDPKLKARICKYLEENKNKQYIDMQDMSKNLHTRYPEYNRKKFKAFQEICDAGFDFLQKFAAADQTASTIEISESSSDESSNSRKKKKSEESDTDARQKTVTDIPKNVDTYSVVKMTTPSLPKPKLSSSEVVEVPVEKAVTPAKTPVVLSIKRTPTSESLTKSVKTPTQKTDSDKKTAEVNVTQPTTLPSSDAAVELHNTVSTKSAELLKSVELSKTVETEVPKTVDTEIELQLETPKRFNVPTPRPQSKKSQPISGISTPTFSPSVVAKTPNVVAKTPNVGEKTPNVGEKTPNVGEKTPNGKNVVDLTDDDEDTLSELRLNGVSNKSSRKSSRAPSPITASIKKSIVSRKKGPDFEVQRSSTTFSQLGGVDKVLVQICKLLIHLKHPEVYKHIGVSPARGILLHGPPGCGKTLLANAIAGELKLPILKLAATEIVSGISGESESRLRDLFDQAMAAAPCLLFIDEIDAITQRRDQSNKGMESRIVGQLLACMDDLNTKGNEKEGQVVVIGATNRPDVLDPALRRAGRFESEIAIGIPDENSRKQILDVMSRDLNVAPTFEMRQLARMTPGYVGADLASLLREAAINAVNRILQQLQPGKDSLDKNLQLTDLLNWLGDNSPVPPETLATVQIDLSDFEKALKTVQPSSMREGFATVPNVTWSDVGALTDIREELEVSILAPVNYPELTEALGLEAPTGILLCGPPGCGKTLLAKAVANQAGINFISVKGPELLNMYVGESERAVRQVFQRAKNSAPCVIFFDELDSLAPRRSGSGDSSGASRVVNQLLTEMDGVEGRKGVYVMAATNRLDIIDPAVLRPGRLQKILHVDLPSCEDRISILKAITKKRPLLAPDVDYAILANDKRCDGFSGADLSALVTEASMSAFKEHIKQTRISGSVSGIEVRVFLRHFDWAFDKVKPSVTGKDKIHYETLKRKQQGNLSEKSSQPVAGISSQPSPEKVPKLNLNVESHPQPKIVVPYKQEIALSDQQEKQNALKQVTPTTEKVAALLQEKAFTTYDDPAREEISIKKPEVIVSTAPETIADETQMDTESQSVDEMMSSPSSDSPDEPKVTRFLERMEVRVKDSSSTQAVAGCEGVVTCVIRPDTILFQVKDHPGDEVEVLMCDLEPFIPEPGDPAKILISGDSQETVQVIDYYSNPDFDDPDEENVTVKFLNGDIKIVPIDQLCKIVP